MLYPYFWKPKWFQIVDQKLVNLTPQKAKGTCKLRRRSILTEGNGIQRRGCVSFLRCKNRWCDSSFQKYGYNIVFERKLGGPNCNYIYSDLTECTELTEVNGRGCISVLRSKDKGGELSFLKYRYSIVFERYLGGAICNYLLHISLVSMLLITILCIKIMSFYSWWFRKFIYNWYWWLIIDDQL